VLGEIAATMREAMVDPRQELPAPRTVTTQELCAVPLETSRQYEHLREAEERDLRILLAGMITVSLGLAAMMAKGFHRF
jgi:hypothetical protein